MVVTSFSLDLELDRQSFSHVLNVLATWLAEEPCLFISLTVEHIRHGGAVRIALTGKISNEVMPLGMVLEHLKDLCALSQTLVK